MKITKHVDFESLLSKTASTETIVEALKVEDELDSHKDTKIEKIAESQGDKAVADTAQVGALGAGVMAYGAHSAAKKQTKKLGKQYKKLKKTEDYANRPFKKRVSDFFKDLTKKPKVKKPASHKVLKKLKKAEIRGKKGAALALGAAGTTAAIGAYKAYKNRGDEQGKLNKTAASEEVRGQIANDVERDSTPSGGAVHRGTQGAIVGGLAGFMHGASKKSPIKGKKARILRGAWHGTAGAVWGGGALGAATYAKKKIIPDSAEDKQEEFNKRLEKRAGIAYIGDLDLAFALAGTDKTASVVAIGKGLNRAMDFTTPVAKSVKKSAATTFNPGTKGAVTIGGASRKKPTSMAQAMAGKGRAAAKNVKEQAFINGDNKGTGVMGGLRRAFSGLTSPDSAVGKLGRKTVW